MPGYGFAGHVGLAKEASFGTAVTVDQFIEAMSENLTLAIDRFDVKNIVGRFSEPDDMAGVRRVAGSVVVPAHPVEIGHFLTGAMAVTSVASISDEIAETTFNPRTADWDGVSPQEAYTFELFRDVTSAQIYAGCNISELAFNVAPNQDLRATATIVGKSVSNATPQSATFTSSPTEPMAFDTCSVSIGGAASTQLEALNISIGNQLQGVPTLANDTNITKIRRTGPQLIRVSGSIGFEDIDEYENFRNQTEQALLVSFFRANSFQMIFDIPRFVYTTFPLGAAGRDRQVVGFEGFGRYHSGSAQAIEVRLTTTKSDY